MEFLNYDIISFDPYLHRVEMRLIFSPSSFRSIVALPNWIPGSYKIRDFSKNIITLNALADGKPVACVAIDKHRWMIETKAEKVEIQYSVYAKDISVRTAYLDDQLFFFNPICLCLFVEEKENKPCVLNIAAPHEKAFKTWTLETALTPHKKDKKGFGSYIAQDYDELIDSPFLIGNLETISFKVRGIEHRMALVGARQWDSEILKNDLKKICETQIDFFGKSPVKKSYVFLTWLVGNGYGGLEHRSSCALIASRDNLPFKNMPKSYQPYMDFLSLCSHEYFHTWHVKATKPEAFMPYNLSMENYTRQLWIFEGFTSYYEDIFLARAGLITEEQYLNLFSQKLTQVERQPGHLIQSASDSSFSAWIKFYDPNENSPNVTVSYYAKGALIAWGLDIMLRRGGQYTLDHLLCYLWNEYGSQGIGVPEGTVEKIIMEWGGKKLAKALDVWVNGVDPLPLLAWAKASGWKLTHVYDAPDCRVSLGVRVLSDGKIAVCLDDGAAQHAGISAGDELVACNGLAMRGRTLSDILRRYNVGDTVSIHVFRGDVLLEYAVVLREVRASKVILELE